MEQYNNSTKFPSAGSSGDLCVIFVSSVGSDDSAPATTLTANVCNHKSVVSMLQKSTQCFCP